MSLVSTSKGGSSMSKSDSFLCCWDGIRDSLVLLGPDSKQNSQNFCKIKQIKATYLHNLECQALLPVCCGNLQTLGKKISIKLWPPTWEWGGGRGLRIRRGWGLDCREKRSRRRGQGGVRPVSITEGVLSCNCFPLTSPSYYSSFEVLLVEIEGINNKHVIMKFFL